MATNIVKSSKFLALVLRHNPSAAGITLDENGWADIAELMIGARKARKGPITMDLLEELVNCEGKKRFVFNEDKSKIRAAQGHSIEVDLKLEVKTPPPQLLHGTSHKSISAILKEGLSKMNRHHVHLSDDFDTAAAVGRRYGRLVMLIIDSQSMIEDGYTFYQSENNVWLTDHVPVKYITVYNP